MFRASESVPDKYPGAENVLLELVGEDVDETRKVLDYWRSDVDLPGVVLDSEEQMLRRRFELTRKANGMVAGEFSLPTLEGEALLAAVDTRMPPPGVGDDRTNAQRRADALGDLARDALEGSASPIVGGARPHINVHVDIPALQGRVGGLHETADGFVLDPFAVSRLACDASVTRIVFGPNSEVLDVGRKTRVIPAGLRRDRKASSPPHSYRAAAPGRAVRRCARRSPPPARR